MLLWIIKSSSLPGVEHWGVSSVHCPRFTADSFSFSFLLLTARGIPRVVSVVLGGPFVGDDSPLTGVEHWGVSSQFSLFTARGIPWVVSVIFGGPITGDDAQLTGVERYPTACGVLQVVSILLYTMGSSFTLLRVFHSYSPLDIRYEKTCISFTSIMPT